MIPRKLNCWEEMRCGREPGGARVAELGPCPAATEAACDGVNSGTNAGRLCWTVAGTLCRGPVPGTFADKAQHCPSCPFFRRVKYEEGCRFQLLRPGMSASDPRELHRLLNRAMELIGLCRDIFACLSERALLGRVVGHALALTGSAAASAYLFSDSGDALVLTAQAGSLGRPERVGLAEDSPTAEAARHRRFSQGPLSLADGAEPATVAVVPIGGRERLAGVLECVKTSGPFSRDDEWFLRELSLMAALGIDNARLVEDLRQLKRFDKAKSRFVALLMHHIGSPLATIACSLHALAQLGGKLAPEDRDKLMQVSLDRIGSVQDLTRRLLDLAAIRDGRALGQVQPLCPADVLREEVETRLARARAAGIALTLTEPADRPRVRADPDGLRVVFANLLDNALKYCLGPVKEVAASVAVERREVRVSVRDTGIGIPPEDQGQVFEEFHRARNAAAARVPGHGLGLAISREIVIRYGGHVELESTVGVGTTISVVLPLLEPCGDSDIRGFTSPPGRGRPSADGRTGG